MANEKHSSGHQGQVRDPEHDGRLKENRESGRTKGTTPGSAERQQEAGHAGGSQGGGHPGGGQQQRGEAGSGSDDLKSREYRDKDGTIHHHTHTAGKK